MCLATVTKINKKNGRFTVLKEQPKKKIGYKVYRKFKSSKGKITYEASYGDIEYSIGKTYTSSNDLEESDDSILYPAGFHIITNREDARKIKRYWDDDYRVILQVEFSDVIAEGTEDQFDFEMPCIIARKMKIIKEVR